MVRDSAGNVLKQTEIFKYLGPVFKYLGWIMNVKVVVNKMLRT